MQLADRYLSEQNYEQAIIEFEKVLEIEPMNVDAYLGLAEAYMALGETDKAVRILEEGVEKTGSDRLRERLEEIRDGLKAVTTEAEVTVTVTVTAPVETTAAVTTVGATTAAVTTVAETTAAEVTTKAEINTTIPENNEIEEVQTYYTVQKGDTIKLTVNTNQKIEWTSFNPYVAEVDQNGTVNVLHKGRASVRAKYGNETKFIVIDSLSEGVRNAINNAVLSENLGNFGTLEEVIVYPSYYNSAASGGEIIERDDYDDSAYSFEVGAAGGRKAFVYNYFYLENDIGENNHIITDGSTYNGLSFYDCKTSFYKTPYCDICTEKFSTKGKITFNAELFYQKEIDPDGYGDQFYFKIQSDSNVLPYFKFDSSHDTIFAWLNTSETLKNALMNKLDKNNSLGTCKITIENYSSYFYFTRGAGNNADLVKVEILGNTYTG